MTALISFKRLLILIFFTFTCLFYVKAGIVAQEGPEIKFGKVTEAELLMKTCAIDTTAGAVILGDYGTSYFIYDQIKERFFLNFERHVRIKILNKNGLDAANEEIAYYRHNSKKDEVYNVKGFTYNLEGGKILKSKLEKEGIFDEVVNDNWTLKKISMPNVKEGSVVEYTYIIKSPFYYNLQEWEFQKNIPILWSQYEVKIPEFFDYKVVSQGFEPFVINEKKHVPDFITLHSKERNDVGRGSFKTTQTTFSSNKIDFQTLSYKWATQNVPAILSEPYMTTINDYVSKIEFELASIQFPRSIREDYSRNWATIIEELVSHERFGKQIEKGGFLKNEIIKINSSSGTQEEKALAIYNFVKTSMKWNGVNKIFAAQNLKKSFEEKTGNSADINLLLVAMLKEAGFDAEPLILSTRDHGRVNMHWPIINKFNYVIAHVLIGENEMLLDATDPFLPSNILPYKCLNGEGKVISKKRPHTVAIGKSEKHSQFFSAKYDVDKDGKINGTVQYSRGSLLASEGRKKIYLDGKDKYIEDVIAKNNELEIKDYQIVNFESINESLKEEYSFTSGSENSSNSVIYFNPLLIAARTENPFKLLNRKFPVDFGCPLDETVVIQVNLPEGYKVDEMPQNMIVSLPNNHGRFSFNASQLNNTLQLTSRIIITNKIFFDENYLELREFFDLIVAQHNSQIVLKKI